MIRTIWVCDGCDVEMDMTNPQHKSDWKNVKMNVDGFDGYPTFEHSNKSNIRYDLCPSCALQLANSINPKLWPRAAHNPEEM